MEQSEKLKALQSYFKLMSMKGAVEVYHAAVKCGVLQAFANGPMTAAAIAETSGLNLKAVTLLLRTLTAMELLEKEEAHYRPALILSFLAHSYQDLSKQYWDYLPTFLETGIPMQRMDDPVESARHYKEQVHSLHWMMLAAAETVSQMIDFNVNNILDVGAGSAVWSLAIARHRPACKVTALDWPEVLPITQQYADKEHIGERFNTLSGNYHQVALAQASYELIILANVIHLEDEDGIARLIKRLRPALKPGGKIIIIDVFHHQKHGELNAALYEMGLSLRTGAGQVHEPKRVEKCLVDAQFEYETYRPILAPPYTMGIIMANKGE